MAPQDPAQKSRPEKRRAPKKKKRRTQAPSTDSESESETEQKNGLHTTTSNEQVGDAAMEEKFFNLMDRPATTSIKHVDSAKPDSPSAGPKQSQTTATSKEEEFESIYLRKVTAELADDLDAVREAPDFKNDSLPLLIHALKQGQSIFTDDDKRRATRAVNM